MKKPGTEERPLLIIERNPVFLYGFIGISILITYIGCELLKDVDPLGFIVLVPAAILVFQSLWLILNPFAHVYEDKIEIKQSLVHHKFRYFVDIKKVAPARRGSLYIIYNDDEVELLNLYGIRHSQMARLQSEMEKQVSASIKTRP